MTRIDPFRGVGDAIRAINALHKESRIQAEELRDVTGIPARAIMDFLSPTPADILRSLIATSGLTNSAYARQVMRCDPRTLRRWLSGERLMQPRTLAWIDAQEALQRCR